MTVDIAHQRETVTQALGKALNQGWQGYTRPVRLIVGEGLIREVILGELYFYRAKGVVLVCTEEPENRASVLVRIR